MTLQGKGFYIWQIDRCEGGDINRIADLAQQANLSHVLIKVADRGQEYYKNKGKIGPLAQALRSRGVAPWGWQYVYGYEPSAEAQIAVQMVNRYNLSGFVVNAEHQYKEPGKRSAARTYMRMLRDGVGDKPIGLSSYRYPSYHPQLPWREFLDIVDYNVPQVYWQGSSNPAVQLQRCLREFQGMSPVRPIIATGAAYTEHNWTPKKTEIVSFMRAAQDNNLSAVNFWEWAAARKLGFWDTIAKFQWGGGVPKAKDIAEKYIDALNSRKPDEVVNLYAPNGVHVSSLRTVQGIDHIRAWYAQFFMEVLPNATYTLTGFSGTGSSRHVTWTATSYKGSVLNGNDTFGLMNDKISYHYTFFTVT